MIKTPVILDTNILVYLNNKYINRSLKQHIDVIIKENLDLSISDITVTELLAKATKSKERQAYDWIKTLQLKRIEVTPLVLELTGYFSRIYIETKMPVAEKEIADKIIAATSFLEQTYILTADVNDFPRPFFLEYDHALIQYNKDQTISTIFVALLRPNNPLINTYLENSQ